MQFFHFLRFWVGVKKKQEKEIERERELAVRDGTEPLGHDAFLCAQAVYCRNRCAVTRVNDEDSRT